MAKINVRPLGGRVLVKLDPVSEARVGQVYLPRNEENPSYRLGTVLACGTGFLLKDGTRAPFSVRPGMRVVVSSVGARLDTVRERELFGDDLLFIYEEDVIADVGTGEGFDLVALNETLIRAELRDILGVAGEEEMVDEVASRLYARLRSLSPRAEEVAPPSYAVEDLQIGGQSVQ